MKTTLKDIKEYAIVLLIAIIISIAVIGLKTKLQNDYDNMTPEEQSHALTREKVEPFYAKRRTIFFK